MHTFLVNQLSLLFTVGGRDHYRDREDVIFLGSQLGIGFDGFDKWHSVSFKAFAAIGGRKLLDKYGSMWGLISNVFPERKWHAFKFGRVPRGYWHSLEHQRDFLEYLAIQLNVKEGDLDGWYRVSQTEVDKLGAGTLLDLYGGSFPKLLSAVYPNHPWDVTKFHAKHRNYWSSLENQKEFMDELGKKVGIHSETDFDKWYDQTIDFIESNGGRRLSIIHKGQLGSILTNVYPNYNWRLWRFHRGIRRVLQSEDEVNKMLEYLETALDIRQPEDWYRVTIENLNSLKVPVFYRTTEGGIAALLSKRYPHIDWDPDAFFGRGYRRASQRWLAEMLTDLFPKESILVDYSHPELKFQLDVFFPELHLAFEYQGLQHYEQLGVYGDLSDRLARDESKAAQCLAHGITLITVPFWWNKKRPALLAAILAERPDLFLSKLAAFSEEARRS